MKDSVFELTENYLLFSHFWFATPQDVLQADWQEVWHSPQPPFFTVLAISFVSIVLILFILKDLRIFFYKNSIAYKVNFVNRKAKRKQ